MGSHFFCPPPKASFRTALQSQVSLSGNSSYGPCESFMNVPFRYLTIVGITKNNQNYYFVTNQNATVKSQRDPIT